MLPCTLDGEREALPWRKELGDLPRDCCFHDKELSGREGGGLTLDGGCSGFKGIGVKMEVRWDWRGLEMC